MQAVQKGKTVIIERGNLAIHEGKETVKETTMIGKLEDHVRENGEMNPFQKVEVSRTREWRQVVRLKEMSNVIAPSRSGRWYDTPFWSPFADVPFAVFWLKRNRVFSKQGMAIGGVIASSHQVSHGTVH